MSKPKAVGRDSYARAAGYFEKVIALAMLQNGEREAEEAELALIEAEMKDPDAYAAALAAAELLLRSALTRIGELTDHPIETP